MDKVMKCTLGRVIWIDLMALITVFGVVVINEFKEVYIGALLIFIGVGLFFYKLKTWKWFIGDSNPADI